MDSSKHTVCSINYYSNVKHGNNTADSVWLSNFSLTGDAQASLGEQSFGVTGTDRLNLMRLHAGNNITFDTSYGVISMSAADGVVINDSLGHSGLHLE